MNKKTTATIIAALAIAATGCGAVTQVPTQASLGTRFAYLSKQTSNRCLLDGAAVMRMPRSAQLQGSCCTPMDRRAFDDQLHKLAHYKNIAVVPQDPYDISVALAQRLLRYRSIQLTTSQERIYHAAIPLSSTRGPCCCQCWRAEAFDGQAKYLITRDSHSARQIAAIWGAEEGCGGPED